MKDAISSVALEAAKKLVSKEMDEETQKKYIDDFIDKAGNSKWQKLGRLMLKLFLKLQEIQVKKKSNMSDLESLSSIWQQEKDFVLALSHPKIAKATKKHGF